jgi:hypothetical protein
MELTAVVAQIAWLLAVSVCSSPTPWERADASGELFEGMSPQDFGLRPGNPLDELPPPDLIEPPNKMLDPRPHDLNATVLRLMLGRNFDPQFMSITRPRYVNIGSLQMPLLSRCLNDFLPLSVVLFLMVVLLLPDKNPFAVQLNNIIILYCN